MGKTFGPFKFQVAFSNLGLLSPAPDSSDILLQLTWDFSKLPEPKYLVVDKKLNIKVLA